MAWSGVLEKDYQFEYEIGQWTFGRIQAVREKATQQKKFCKSVSKLNMRVDLKHVKTQLRQLQRLHHPNICGLNAVLEDEVYIHLITDHCDGGEVSELMERMGNANWLDERTVAVYVKHVLVATAHCHSARVIHRDLKVGCLGLTSKLPDASVKVMDFGLAQAFDPNGYQLRERPNSFVAPEMLADSETPPTDKVDIWSIGVLSYALLINELPFRLEKSGSNSELLELMRHNPIRFYRDDGWAERSVLCRDFIRALLKSDPSERLTAAQALHHPWIKRFAGKGNPFPKVNLVGPSPDDPKRREEIVRDKLLICTMGCLLSPVQLQPHEFEECRQTFQAHDLDRDGWIVRGEVGNSLRVYGLSEESITKLLDVVDIYQSGVFHLCGLMVVGLFARHFSNELERLPNLPAFAQALQQRCFEAFDDRRGPNMQPAVSAEGILSRIRTNTMRMLEAKANVNFKTSLAALPEERLLDAQTFVSCLAQAGGKGTPFAVLQAGDDSVTFSEDDLDELPWMTRISEQLTFSTRTLLCPTCSAIDRDSSPYSLRVH